MPTIDARFTDVKQDIETQWYRIVTDHANVKRLDTRDDELAQQVAVFKRDETLVRITYNEKESKNVNPNTGRPYINRYLESIAPLQGQMQIEEIPKVSGRKTDPDDAWRMCLNKGGELALRSIPFLDERERRDWRTLTRIARAWAEFFYFTERPQFPAPTTNGEAAMQTAAISATTQRIGAYDEPLGLGSPPPHSDDDIPY